MVKNGNNHAMFAFGQVSGVCYSERVKMSFTGCMWASMIQKELCMSHISPLIYMTLAFLSIIPVPRFVFCQVLSEI